MMDAMLIPQLCCDCKHVNTSVGFDTWVACAVLHRCPALFGLMSDSAVMVNSLATRWLSPSPRTMLAGAVVSMVLVGPRRSGEGCDDVSVRVCEKDMSLSSILLPSLGKEPWGYILTALE